MILPKREYLCTFANICNLVYNETEKRNAEVRKMFGKRKGKKVRIPVNEYEYRLMLDALLSFRDKLIAQGRYTDGVDETILAITQ